MSRKQWIKGIVLILLIVTMGIAYAAYPIVSEGIQLYRSAIEEWPLESRVEAVRKGENFVALDEVTPVFIELLIENEDHRFYNHRGFSWVATSRAIVKNIEAKAPAEGGSSITQQLAKNLYFSFEKVYERKIAELLVAFDLEKHYTKDEILELYINIAYFGEGNTGLRSAAMYYYNVAPIDLSYEEALVLVKTLKSPNNLNPNALKKRNQ